MLLSLACVNGPFFLAPTGGRLVFILRFLAKLAHFAHLRRSNKLTVGYCSHTTVSNSVVLGMCSWPFLTPIGAELVFTLRFLAKIGRCAHLRPSNKLMESMAIIVVELSAGADAGLFEGGD